MAEIHPSSSDKKKQMPKVDLTPMVDLGFLLITFFVFTTTMTEGHVMKLNTPKNGPPVQTGERKTLNLILGADDKLLYYEGNDSLQVRTADYSATGLRRVITEKKQQVRKDFGYDSLAVFLIKPTNYSSYKNLVDVMDEMLISDVSTYMIADASVYETQKAISNKR